MAQTTTKLLRFIGVLAFITTALAASAQTPVTYRVPMFENKTMKVWKTIIVPNSPLTMHRHEHGRTIVVLKGGTLTIQQDTGEKKKVDWKTGQAYWLDADPPGNKMHADVNETNDTIEVMVVENKNDK
ncbi:MAG: hypothetical protein ABJA70_18950 [Chryseolinea sp.]